MKAVARVLLVLLLAAAIAPAAASACPLCKEAKADTDYAGGTASLPKGFYYSIILMVAAPFAVVGGLGLRIYMARRRVLAASGAAQGSSRPAPPSAAAARMLPDSRGAQP
jgi:hypothetical protein